MTDLLSRWTLSEIVIFVVIFAIALRRIVEYFDWIKTKREGSIAKEAGKQIKSKEQQVYQDNMEKRVSALENNQEKIVDLIDKLDDKVDLLIESDKDDIKSFLTREHHYFCYTLKSIDDYSLECCERRYAHYAKEGGNSFISAFMDDLRKLPKHGAGYILSRTVISDNDIIAPSNNTNSEEQK